MPNRNDTLTLMAVAVIAYALSSVIHEGIGHGGACLLIGGHPRAMSTNFFDGDSNHPKIVASGGTVANLLFGSICWLFLRVMSRRRNANVSLRYFVWLLMTINLLQGGGYFLFSGVGNIGDWAEVIAGWQPLWLWRVALIVLGVVTYYAFIRVSLKQLMPFLPATDEYRWRAARKLMLTPYFTGGVLSLIAGMLNPVGLILVAISSAAASLGGTSALAWSWQLLRSRRYQSAKAGSGGLEIPRDYAWIVAGAVIAATFVALLGPGITFSPHNP